MSNIKITCTSNP